MSDGNDNRWLERRARFLLMFAAAVAATVAFAWRSQGAQDVRINANEKSVAVIDARLGSIIDKLDEIKDVLETHEQR